MSSTVAAPYSFWNSNPVLIPHNFDNEKYKFDSIVIVSQDISKVNVPESSYLKGFVNSLKIHKEVDAAFDETTTFVVSKVSGYEGIKKLVHSPTGPLDRHYDDVRRFADAANHGIERVLKSGAKRPILAVLYESANSPNDKYGSYALASILGAAEAIYVPLEIREDVPQKSAKVEILGFTTLGQNTVFVPQSSAIELGRVTCRDIGGSDPERMAAPYVAIYVKEMLADTPVKVDVVDNQDFIDKNYPLLGAVNRAAKGVKRHSARVIFLTYEPEGPCNKTLVLVGKGVTYDTGGADIKAGGHMAGMHRDKCGAAAVAGILQTAAKLRPKGIKIIGAMSMVRNSVGSECYVSDEIVTSRAGVRVRVGNTDAEGRMAMADVLCHMKEKVLSEGSPNPHLFTLATLTGHACLAVGDGYTIVMENGAAAAGDIGPSLQKSGAKIGDNFEISTIRREDYEFHKGKSEYEDLLQCNNAPSSQTSRGHQSPAAFLIMASGLDKHDTNSASPLKYCHVDIAASSGPFPGIPSGSPVPAFSTHFLME